MISDNTNKIMKEKNIKAKKMFGQNFLKDKKVLDDIVKASDLIKTDYVIEIGPGLGALTERLCQNANKVLCYEIDNDLAALLPTTLKNYDNYKIINEDYLKRDIEKDIDEYLDGANEIKVVANIPYNITTPIVFSLLKSKRVKTIVLMVQKELAERFSSDPSNKEYGSITAYLAHMGENKIIRTVSRNCFEPAPNVDSAVYRFIRKNNDTNEDYLKFLRDAFLQKRKKITNNLDKKYDKQVLIKYLVDLGYDENVRAEAMKACDLHKLYLLLAGEQNEN